MEACVGVDRRILRAFYTQYVAVLLIILVFCVGSVYKQSTQQRQEPELSQEAQLLASVRYPEFFTALESAEISDTGGIKAISEVLTSHDLRGVFAIPAFISGNAQEVATTVGLRAKALRTRAAQDGIPAQAIKIVVVPSRYPSATVYVSFESMELRDVKS